MSLVVRDGIHSGIDLQFPALYREDGEFMVEFTKAYYKFLDERMDRNIPKLRDIDTTLVSFLIFFKKKYLADLPLDTVIDTRFIIKHVSDLYKRKGTQESLELLFQLFYNETIEVFYPATNILKPSDSIWGGDAYLEMKPVFVVNDYPIKKGDRIKGDISLASAFVDELIFVNFRGALTPIVYMSSITGKFGADDGIITTRAGVTEYAGKLISGSISGLTVSNENRVSGQTVGDRVKLISNDSGIDAIASVLSISEDSTGEIHFTVGEGGFGYVNPSSTTATNKVGISNQVLIIAQNTQLNIRPGDIITCYNSQVTSATQTFAIAPTPINGSGVVIAYRHPLLYINTLDPEARTARLTEVVPQGDPYAGLYLITTEMLRAIVGLPTATEDWDIIFESISPNGFKYGDITHTGVINGGFTSADVLNMEMYILGTLTNTDYINHIEQYLLPALGIYKQFTQFPSGNNALNTDSNPRIITDMSAPFQINSKTLGEVYGTLTTIGGYNNSASYEVSEITNTEYVTLITDQIGDYVDIALSASNYGMSGAGSQNINTTLTDAFTPLTVEIGTISNLKILSSGLEYENDVYSKVDHTNISKFDKRDLIINFSQSNILLQAGSVATQLREIEDLSYAITDVNNVDVTTLGISEINGNYPSSTTITLSEGTTIPYTAKAKFLRRVGDDYYFRQLSFYDFNSTLPITADGSTYTIERIRRDPDSAPMGANATINGLASYDIGQISGLSIISSGYRYRDGEVVDVVNFEPSSPNYNETVATATIRVLGSGITEGKWKTTTSFLSDSTKRIQDSNYYQEYSYEVSSIIDPAIYEPLIKDTIGVAGTKIFSSPLINSINNVSPTLDVEIETFVITEESLTIILSTEGDDEALITEPNTIVPINVPAGNEPISIVIVTLDELQNL